MLTYTIDVFEKIDITTIDISGAFLETNMTKREDDVHVILDGHIAQLLAKIAPET